MGPELRHIALAIVLVALLDASARLVAPVFGRRSERLLATIVAAASIAWAETLASGLFGGEARPISVAAATVVIWLAVRLRRPRAALGTWRGTGPAAGAAVGAAAVYVIFLLVRPLYPGDNLTYHLPQVIAWVQGVAAPGATVDVHRYPVGAFPLNHEVLLTWPTMLAHSFVPAVLSAPIAFALVIFALNTGLQRCAVPATVRALAIAAICLTPGLIVGVQAGGDNDIATVAWLATGWALALAIDGDRVRMAVALAAIGMAVGTKTTVLPVAVLMVAWIGWSERRTWRGAPAVWWLLGVVPAAALALVWYMKSLVQHGSPLWPVVRGPWGDPLPAINGTGFRPFLADPVFMVKHHARDYYANLGGSLVLLAGGCALTVFGGRRNVRLYGLVVVVACLAYGAAPSSGVPEAGGQVVAALTSVRYLYPAIAVAAIALALAAVRHERVRILAMAIFGIAIVLGIERFLRQSTEVRPHVWLLVAGTAAGALLAIVLRRAPSLPRVLPPAIATLGVAVVAGSLAAWSADGLVRRQAAGRVDEGFVRWAAARDAFSRGDMRFRIAPDEFALLAGDQLQNHIMRWHVPPGPCSRVSPARAGMWLVLWGPDARPPCDGGPAPAQHSHRSWVFALMSDAAFGQGSGTPDSSS